MKRYRETIGFFLASALAATGGGQDSIVAADPLREQSLKDDTKIQASPEAVVKAKKELELAADRARRMRAALSFEDFKATVYRETFAGGKFIVNGDTSIPNEKQLREFYDQQRGNHEDATRSILSQIGGMDNKWNSQQMEDLSYCVSLDFGKFHAEVVLQMAIAADAWKQVSGVNFRYDANQDATCGPNNTAVVFDVRPVSGQKYLARAFFPNEARAQRNVLIDSTSLSLPQGEKLTLAGILRHELGHTLGFRHEQTRPDAGVCFEDWLWKPLTSYDAFSVMHYPQCNGSGDWSLQLTINDKVGAACVYGAKPSFVLDRSLLVKGTKCFSEAAALELGSERSVQNFTDQAVQEGSNVEYGPFYPAPGTIFEVQIGGPNATGDPDLYVRFDTRAGRNAFDCRPYLDGPEEVCALDTPANAGQAYVMVRGFTKGKYDLMVKFFEAKAAQAVTDAVGRE